MIKFVSYGLNAKNIILIFLSIASRNSWELLLEKYWFDIYNNIYKYWQCCWPKNYYKILINEKTFYFLNKI